jgi:transitional endoplasmic reticulum ATPase
LKIHTRNMPLAKDVDLDEYASISHGFVGADLSALCKEAAMARIRKLIPNLNLKEDQIIPQDMLDKISIDDKDFKEALKLVQPSAMREVYVESPNIKWSMIGGLENIKQELKEAVELPLKNPGAFKRLGIRPPRGVLMYGPPGTGKTLLAKAVATESEANFIQIKGPELLSKWVGESEKGVRKVFDRARQVAPCIVFFDEIDALASRRGYDSGSKATERVLNQMLAEMDGLVSLEGIVVIGATNRPDMLDSALLRPGRFDRIVSITVPDKVSRLEIFKVHTKNMPIAKDVNLQLLAEKSENLVGADIESICREAAMLALRDDINVKEVKKKYFDEALKKIKPSVTAEDAKQYKDMEVFLRRAKPDKMDMPAYMG